MSEKRLGNIAETLVRSELEKLGWTVYRASGEENVRIDMIAAKWSKGKLVLRAIQVKSRTKFGTDYPTVQWEIEHRDKKLFYITALPPSSYHDNGIVHWSDEEKWTFYIVPTNKVKTEFLNIKKNGKYEKYRNNWERLEPESADIDS